MTRQYAANGLAGCVEQRKARTTGTVIGVYHGGQSGMESDPSQPWATVCEAHNSICMHDTLALARSHASDPAGWCEWCRLVLIRDQQGRYARQHGPVVEWNPDRNLAEPMSREDAARLRGMLSAQRVASSTRLALPARYRLDCIPLDSDDIARLEQAGDVLRILNANR